MYLAYKQVVLVDGVFRSLCHDRLGRWSVTYELGKITKPSVPGSRLFAYLEREQAVSDAAAWGPTVKVLVCEVPNRFIYRNNSIVTPRSAEFGWHRGFPVDMYDAVAYRRGSKITGWCDRVYGSILVPWVRPLEVIDGL